MFLKIGNDYINTAQIRRIRPFVKENDRGHYVMVEMLDGAKIEGHCKEDRVAALTRHYLPAPSGTEVSIWANESGTLQPIAELQRETLVGFAYDGFEELCPVTVESGVLESPYNLKSPDGRVRASWGEEFESEDKMIAAARTRFAKAA
ncbi:hypothetical protein [Bradyrhizobium algeriense]|uniref:hypothetical protein n=1 Tax=Bradyrhizobium algeriense TaxID=634784 RepID=UPI0011AE7CB0|nr:hypothetical protein [Bradyrhizobium algeriense]